MKLGLGSYTFRWSIGHKDIVPDAPMTAMECLNVAEKQGLTVVQYADNLPLGGLSDTELDDLATRARDKGIALELGIEALNVAEVTRYIGIGQRIGAGILRVALDAADAQRPVADVAADFLSLVPLARAAKVRIAIENHFNFPSRRMVEVLKAVDDPSLGVCLDVANSICAGEWPMETVGILAPYTINLHLKDYVIVPDAYGVGFTIVGCPLGQGRTDIGAVMAALSHCSDDMSIVLEHWLPREADMATTRQREHHWLATSVEFAKRTLPI